MNNNTPPAWAFEAAQQSFDALSANKDKYQVAEIIAALAPDAEALAVALEELLNITDLEGAHVNHNPATCTIARSTETLAAYRARFPKE